MNCPICFEELQMTNNMVTTECGHQFHASCLMKHAAFNGFSCPCCRSVMAEKDDEMDSEYDSDSETSNETSNETNSLTTSDCDDDSYEPTCEDDYILRGFRFFMNRIDCNEDTDEDIEDENEDQLFINSFIDRKRESPPAEYLIKKMQDQNISMQQLIHILLISYHPAYDLPRGPDMENKNMMNRIIYTYSKELNALSRDTSDILNRIE